MSNPLSYMVLIKKWVQLGKKKYLVVYDGFNKRNIEIKFAKDITIRNQKLKTYLLQSGLGHIYVFCDQKFKIIGMTNGSSDFVDQDWETFLPV